MLRSTLPLLQTNGPKNAYTQKQVKMLTSALTTAKNFTYPENLSAKLLEGLPTIKRLRIQYPDAKTPEPSIYDKHQQASFNKLHELTYSGQRGYSKLLGLEKQGRLFTYPINSENFNWYDNKIPEKEKNVSWEEHIDFVEKNLAEFKFSGKNSGSANQLYFFLEAVGQGLSKNPYMTLDEKLDDIARYSALQRYHIFGFVFKISGICFSNALYVQYFVHKKEVLLGTQLLNKSQVTTYVNSKLAQRRIRKDHWTREGYSARYDWRYNRATPIDTARPEYFWLKVPEKEHREKLQEFFGDNMVIAADLEKTPVKGSYKSSSFDIKPMNPEIDGDLNNLVRISHFGNNNNEGTVKPPKVGGFMDFKKFDFDSVDYSQIQVEDDSVHKQRDPRFYFDADGPYDYDEDGKKRSLKNQSHIAANNLREFQSKWFTTRYKRKLQAKRARIRKQAGN